MATYLEIPGDATALEKLVSSRARQLAFALDEATVEFARLVECRAAKGADIVVFDVEVEVPQRLAHPIEPFERIAVLFDRDDAEMPEVLALRQDFPRVPHVNLREFELPRSLCLYDERFRDVKRRWTPPRFVEQIRDWLALTAKGALHQDDQPLEPLLFGQVGTIILPADVLEHDSGARLNRLTITATDNGRGNLFLVADRSERRYQKEGFRVVASVHWCEPKEHGIIRHRPGNVKDLAAFVEPAGLNLLAELRARLLEWKEEAEASNDPSILDHHVALVIVMPKTRHSEVDAESRDLWAFLSTDTVRNALKKLGLFDTTDGVFGYILGGDAEKSGEDLHLDLLNPSLRLTRGSAAALNGLRPESAKIAAVGVGALGSQVAMNLARGGFGTWTVMGSSQKTENKAR